MGITRIILRKLKIHNKVQYQIHCQYFCAFWNSKYQLEKNLLDEEKPWIILQLDILDSTFSVMRSLTNNICDYYFSKLKCMEFKGMSKRYILYRLKIIGCKLVFFSSNTYFNSVNRICFNFKFLRSILNTLYIKTYFCLKIVNCITT